MVFRLSPMRRPRPKMRHSQCLCLPKTPSNGGPKPTTHFGYQLKRYAKKHPLSPGYANRRLCRTPGQGGRPGPPQPPVAVHSGLAAPEYAAREPIPDRRSYHREGEPRCRPPSKPRGHADGLLRLQRGGGGERRMRRPSADSRGRCWRGRVYGCVTLSYGRPKSWNRCRI